MKFIFFSILMVLSSQPAIAGEAGGIDQYYRATNDSVMISSR